MSTEPKRRRYGPAPLDAAVKRTHSVSSRFNTAELTRLDTQRAAIQMQRGEYLRTAALQNLPPTIPELNREAWIELSRTSSNLNQIARHLNQFQYGVLDEDLTTRLSKELKECAHLLMLLRNELIGVKGEEDEG